MQFRKKMLMMILACLVGFQPVAKANGDGIFLVGLLLIPSLPILISLSFFGMIKLSKSISDRGYGAYRTLKHKCGFESSQLRKVKNTFIKSLDDLDCNDQSDWKENCHCHLFSKSDDAEKKIENFIEGQEEYNSKSPLKLFGWTLGSLYEKEKAVFSEFSNEQLQDE